MLPRLPLTSSRRAGTAAATLALTALLAPAALAAPASAAAGSVTTRPAAATRGVPAQKVVPPLTAAQKVAATRLTLRATSKVMGTNTSGLVVDAVSGRTVWARRADVPMLPASTTKLATGVFAMATLGPDATVSTKVRQVPGGVVLVGGGDSLLTSADLDGLASRTADALVAAGQADLPLRVWVDDSLFPAPAPAWGWQSSYYPHQVAPVRALIRDQREVMDTSLDATTYFVTALNAHLTTLGVLGRVTGRIYRTVSPADAPVIAEQVSRPMRDQLARMNEVSDNDIAEYLFRLATISTGVPFTWANGMAAERATLNGLGVRTTGMKVFDGSGLSRAGRIPAQTLVSLLQVAKASVRLNPVLTTLPLAGKTGTLKASSGRFVTKEARCAVGRVRGKTGTLTGAVALAGFGRGRGGREEIFAFMVNGKPGSIPVKQAVDGLVATAISCW